MSGARLPASAPRQCLSHGWSREAGPAPRPAGETCLPGPHVKAWRRGVPLRQATAVARAPRRGGDWQEVAGRSSPWGAAPNPLMQPCGVTHSSDPTDPTDSSDGAPSLSAQVQTSQTPILHSHPATRGKLRTRPASGGILHSPAGRCPGTPPGRHVSPGPSMQPCGVRRRFATLALRKAIAAAGAPALVPCRRRRIEAG